MEKPHHHTAAINPISDVIAGESAFPEGRAPSLECSDGSVIVKGVRVPAAVATQLRALGMALEAYSPGELEDAISAFMDDGMLIEDHEGTHLRDKLQLTETERAERHERRLALRDRNVRLHRHLYSDIIAPTNQQLFNPWYGLPPEHDASDRQASDAFELMHFGHDGLFYTVREPTVSGHVPHPKGWEEEYAHDDVPSAFRALH
jgi:hypothetical protein